jgi:anti-anti-sigma factor
MTCEVKTIHSSGTLRIAIRGRFDFSAHQEFRRSYENAAEVSDYVVDLGGTEYVDSSALGMLLLLRERAGDKSVRIVNCSAGVRRILEIANFQKLFKFDPA